MIGHTNSNAASARIPRLTLRATRGLMVTELKKDMIQSVSHGMLTEGLVAIGAGWKRIPLPRNDKDTARQ